MSQPTTTPAAADPNAVTCPVCLDEVTWSESDLFELRADGKWVPIKADQLGSGPRRNSVLRTAFQRCPNQFREEPETHYLPVAYLRHGRPLVIGLVGGSSVGKTHLLTAMIGEIEAGGLRPWGISHNAVDIDLHTSFLEKRKDPLLGRGEMLEKTGLESAVNFVDALLISHGIRPPRPVAFFDVSGDMLAPGDREFRRSTKFLNAVGALIFVADPARMRRLGAVGKAAGTRTLAESVGEDRTFRGVLERLIGRKNGSPPYYDIPAATVIAKSDLLRFEPPVDRWIRRPPPQPRRLDPAAIRQESREAYAFLHQYGGGNLAVAFDECRRATLHFASATGSRGDTKTSSFPLGARPRRVLEPLIALLAMTGVIDEPAAAEVGV